jgi:hypothetical protein
VARVYNLREEIALLLEKDNVVDSEHLRNEHFVSEIAYEYISDIFLEIQCAEHKYARERYNHHRSH